MNRRKAIQQIGVFALSANYLSSCNFSESSDNILNAEEKVILKNTSLMLPYQSSSNKIPETTSDFIITIVTEYNASNEDKKFQTGLNTILESAKGKFNHQISELTQIEIIDWFNDLALSNNRALPAVLKTIKSISVEHFTSSESYLKNHTGFEFIPNTRC